MNAIALLLCLLLAAYVGSALAGRGVRGYGLPSGAEWLLIGVGLGPLGLGAFDSSTIREFQPLVIAGLGWVAMVIGIDYGYVGERRIGWRSMTLGWMLSLFSLAASTLAVWFVARRYSSLNPAEIPTTALVLGLVSCETTRHAVRWVVERRQAVGPLGDLLAELGDADDAVPIWGISFLIAWVVKPDLDVELHFAVRVGITLVLGFGLGLVAAALLAKNLAFGESWTVLLGTALLGVGVSMRMGLAALSVLFIAGGVISLLSHRHSELRALMAPMERPVMLPVLLLAGASLEFSQRIPGAYVLTAAVLLARLLSKLASGYLVSLWVVRGRRSPAATGGALLASGTLSISIGSYAFLELEHGSGALALLSASLTIVMGELFSPFCITRALERAGELGQARQESSLGSESPLPTGEPRTP